jgi:tRNA nucleotidyltransferase (CCA-adding enzyme)
MTNQPGFPLVMALAQRADDLGGRLLLVGGCVRDHLRGIEEPKDLDVEVFGVTQETLVSILEEVATKVNHVGESFPVWKIRTGSMSAADEIDVALPRREVKVAPGHRGFTVAADPTMSFEEASARRDFTFNSMGLDPLTGEVLDPHGGARDLANGVIRHTSSRFAEDPLRVLRGMQFAARFDMRAHPDTIDLCKQLTLEGLAAERIFGEWEKLILKGRTPSKGLQFLHDCEWDRRYFPEIFNLHGKQQNPTWHPEGDAWVHTGFVLDAFARRRTGDRDVDRRVGFACLCHDFGKATHTQFKDGQWCSHGHEAAGIEPTKAFLGRLTDDHAFIKAVAALVGGHMHPSNLYKDAKRTDRLEKMDASVRRLAVSMSCSGTNIQELALVCESDKAGRPPLPEQSDAVLWLRERATKAQVFQDRPKPLLLGRDLIELGMAPGPAFKPILQEAYERQVNGEVSTREEALLAALNGPLSEMFDGLPKITTLFRAHDKPPATPRPPSWSDETPEGRNCVAAYGRWFGESVEDVQWYVNDCKDPEVVRLRLPSSMAEQYRVSNLPLKPGGKESPENPAAFSARPDHEFFVPRALANLATPHQPVVDNLAPAPLDREVAEVERATEHVDGPTIR